MKLTFKNRAGATGLAAIGDGTPSIDIRIDGEDIGINVGFNFIATAKELERNPNAKWHLHYVGRTVDGKFERAKFESGDAAKAWVRANIDRFLPNLYIEKKEIAA